MSTSAAAAAVPAAADTAVAAAAVATAAACLRAAAASFTNRTLVRCQFASHCEVVSQTVVTTEQWTTDTMIFSR